MQHSIQNNSFYKRIEFQTAAIIILLLVSAVIWQWTDLSVGPSSRPLSDTYTPPPKAQRKAGRSAFFHRILKDPRTGRIPKNARSREIAYAKTLPDRKELKMKGRSSGFEWTAIGPNDVGGRTRALGIDVTNPQVIIAGGVSGGIWKSTDGGSTWKLQTEPKSHQSVTSLDQDPREGHTDTWYYATGELFSGSSSDRGLRARYYGTGVYKSTDNGNTWHQMGSTGDRNTSYDSPFDFISRIRVNPETGSVFIASNGFGIFRSTNGKTFSETAVLGGPGHHLFADIDIAKDGTIAAVLSGRDAGADTTTDPGVFVSRNDGDSWTEVTPDGWPSDANNTYERSVIEIAPSNTNIAYVFTYTGTGQGEGEKVLLYEVNLSTGNATNLSDNLPDYGGKTGFVVTQFGYNMALEVHPKKEDFVLLGGRNLYRSFDGFSTPVNDSDQKNKNWIGGYTNSNNGFSSYPNHHPDQHIIQFHPENPSIVWSGHDGGLSKTEDITASRVNWINMDNGYNVTQFYTVSVPSQKGDKRIVGGTQDNGNPFFKFGTQQGSNSSIDIAGGDGGHNFFSENYIFLSLQNGIILRFDLFPGGSIDQQSWAWVQPSSADNQLFVHPYMVDPNDETIMYYPAGNNLWKNSNIDKINYYNDREAQKTGWRKPLMWQDIGPGNRHQITAINVTDTLPTHRIYLGLSAGRDQNLLTDDHPRIYRIDNAHLTENEPEDISIDTNKTTAGAYVHDIAINPVNGRELMVVFSNYNVTSIFHSEDGGESWTAVEGNLAANQPVMGPSVRSASILPTSDGPIYTVGTSAGVYTTTNLDSSATKWVLESPGLIGYSIAEDLDQRTSDRLIAVGSHGRGIFLGTTADSGSITIPDPDPTPPDTSKEKPEEFRLKPNFPNPFNSTTTISYHIPEESRVTLTVYDIQGRKVRELVSNEIRQTSRYQFLFNAAGLSSGIYIVRMRAVPTAPIGKVFTQTQKMTLLK